MGLRALDLNQLKTEIEDLKHSEHEFAFQNLECKVSGHSVLHIESLQIPVGEIVAVIGHNGAGKSTFAGCLCGIRKHTGKVFITGQNGMQKASERKLYGHAGCKPPAVYRKCAG